MNCFIIILEDYEYTSDGVMWWHSGTVLKVILNIATINETTTKPPLVAVGHYNYKISKTGCTVKRGLCTSASVGKPYKYNITVQWQLLKNTLTLWFIDC